MGRPKKTYCLRGHERTPENTKSCRGCKLCEKEAAKLRTHKKSVDHSGLEAYRVRLASQGGHCALCPAVTSWGNRKLSLDHNHACCSKKHTCGNCNRGLLCERCNHRLGWFEDALRSIVTLQVQSGTWYEAAMEYLNRYPTFTQKEQ